MNWKNPAETDPMTGLPQAQRHPLPQAVRTLAHRHASCQYPER
jgi:hypothetical protein